MKGGGLLDTGAVSFTFSSEAGTDRDLSFTMSLPALLCSVRFFTGLSSLSSSSYLFLFVEEDRVGGNSSTPMSSSDLCSVRCCCFSFGVSVAPDGSAVVASDFVASDFLDSVVEASVAPPAAPWVVVAASVSPPSGRTGASSLLPFFSRHFLSAITRGFARLHCR